MKRNELKKGLKKGFVKSIPIMCSYLFLGTAYGIMMEEAGFHWYSSLVISATVFTGAFQFVLITLLSSGASLLTIAVTAFLMNSRQTFYSLTFVEDFRRMGKLMPYMIHTLSDETYAVNCSLEQGEKDRDAIMFWVNFLSWSYWIAGSVAGGIIGQLIPFEMEGIDFCMTALFVIIFIDQWEKSKNHLPAVLGLVISIVCLLILGQDRFMLPALIVVSGILLFVNRNEVEQE